MAHLVNLNGIRETLPAIPNLPRFQKPQKRAKIISFSGTKTDNLEEQPAQTTRRVALGLASIALTATIASNGISLAEDNGWWIDGPIPIPPIYNSKQIQKQFFPFVY